MTEVEKVNKALELIAEAEKQILDYALKRGLLLSEVSLWRATNGTTMVKLKAKNNKRLFRNYSGDRRRNCNMSEISCALGPRVIQLIEETADARRGG